MDYLSHHLLQCIVTEFNLEDVKAQMGTYMSDFQQFREMTPVHLFCQIQRKIKHLPDFEELVVEFSTGSSFNLEDIEYFRQMYAAHYNLKGYSMVFAGVHLSTSFNCTWLIPRSVVSTLTKKQPKQKFFQKHSVSKLSIAGIPVYCFQQVRLMSILSYKVYLLIPPKGAADPFVSRPDDVRKAPK